jgi:hypothetical protein
MPTEYLPREKAGVGVHDFAGISEECAARTVQVPRVAETIDWAQASTYLNQQKPGPAVGG